MTRLVALNRFYAPDESATAQLLTDLCEALAKEGRRVTVITSRLRYDDPAADLPALEERNGVRIRRVRTSRFGRHWLPGRALDYASFYISATLALVREVRPGDTILAKTDPPLLSVPAWLVARMRGADLVNWCQDLYPELAAALGLRWAAGPLGRLLRRLRNASLRGARMNVAICEAMARRLEAEGIPPEKITVIENWADPRIRPVPPEANPLRRAWGLEGKFVVGYSGNLGRAHDPEGVIDLVRRTAGKGVTWLFVGGGAGMAELRRVVEAERLPDVRFVPLQPRERLSESLSVPDLHLVSLDPACEGLLYPSKVYGIRAAGRPLLRLRPGLGVEELRKAAAGPVSAEGAGGGSLERWSAVLEAVRSTPEPVAAPI
ncbi:MAG: glycosyltransferase WbuB [Geminicoccaceae bacterium]|nr:MAG: glycosyltransferase WbuB [Geminicoccaceae bacterium]